jgi:hypothetical protein
LVTKCGDLFTGSGDCPALKAGYFPGILEQREGKDCSLRPLFAEQLLSQVNGPDFNSFCALKFLVPGNSGQGPPFTFQFFNQHP